MLDRENLLANLGMQIRFRLMTVVLTRDQCIGKYNQFCVCFFGPSLGLKNNHYTVWSCLSRVVASYGNNFFSNSLLLRVTYVLLVLVNQRLTIAPISSP